MTILGAAKRLVRASPLGRPLWWLYRGYRRRVPRRFRTQGDRYDHETVEVIRRVLRPDASGVDIGAHNGTILRALLEAAPRGVHYAFEPLPHLAARLAATFPGVRVHEVALSDYTGTASFVHVVNDAAYSGLRPRIYDRPDPCPVSITVRVTRLDDVIPPDHPVAFIKLDIEGGEFHALRGAAATIRRCRPVIVFEAGAKSTGQYGVGPGDVYQLVTTELGCRLSTMRRWLESQPPYTEAAFGQAWQSGDEFYFIAYAA